MTEIEYTIESIDILFTELERSYTRLLSQGLLATDYDYLSALAHEKEMALKYLNRGAYDMIFTLIFSLNKNLFSHVIDADE